MLALFQGSHILLDGNQYCENKYKSHDTFECKTTIHFKKWPHQPVMKAKQYVNWSFYVEIMYKACDLFDGTILASLKQSQFEAMLAMTYLL